MQTDIWKELKERYGWNSTRLLDLQVMQRRLQGGLSFSYIPEVTGQADGLASLAAQAQGALFHARTSSTVFGRVEFLIEYSDQAHQILLQAGFRKARDEVQPEYRQEIGISASLKDIRAQMKQKGRYNIGVAERHGVVVEQDDSPQALEAFIALSHSTASRKGFKGRSATYLRDLITILRREHIGGLWVARYQSEILAGAIIVFWNNRASYLYGASASVHRNVMAPYLLHWRIIEEAKRRECTEYDLIGVVSEVASTNHPWQGISRFKREFGGRTVHYLGSYDRVYKPLLYGIFKLLRGNA